MSQIRRDNSPPTAPFQASEAGPSNRSSADKPKGVYLPPHRRTNTQQALDTDAFEADIGPGVSQKQKLDESKTSEESVEISTTGTDFAPKNLMASGLADAPNSSQARYIPPHQRTASSLEPRKLQEQRSPQFPVPKAYGLSLRSSSTFTTKQAPAKTAQAPKNNNSNAVPSEDETSALHQKATQDENNRVSADRAVGLSHALSNLSLATDVLKLGSIRTAPLRSLVPESSFMTLDNAKAHWDGTPPRDGKEGLSAHRPEFQDVRDQDGNLVATDPAAYASLAKIIANKPLIEDDGHRVQEYVYRVNGAYRIAKYDEATDLLARVDIKSKIITLYRLFPKNQKKSKHLPKVLQPYRNGMALFEKTFFNDMAVTNKGI